MIEKVIFVISLVLSSASVDNAPDRQIAVYESNTAGGSFNAIAISEKYNRLAMFNAPYDPVVWKSDTGGRYAPEQVDGVYFDSLTGLSIPADINRRASWIVDGIACNSSKFFIDRWLVQCAGKKSVTYIFQAGRGVTAFDHYCGRGKKCWFELKSETGVFKNLVTAQ